MHRDDADREIPSRENFFPPRFRPTGQGPPDKSASRAVPCLAILRCGRAPSPSETIQRGRWSIRRPDPPASGLKQPRAPQAPRQTKAANFPSAGAPAHAAAPAGTIRIAVTDIPPLGRSSLPPAEGYVSLGDYPLIRRNAFNIR